LATGACKQVLASSFYYHASFLMPSDALLAKIVVKKTKKLATTSELAVG
jgi:hypothetical protein